MRFRFLLSGLFVSLALSGCGNLTVKDVLEDVGPVYCQRLATCFPSEFATAYPGGQMACVDKFVATGADKADQMSACTQSEVDDCKKDIENLACMSALDAMTLPTSCKKC